MQVRIGSGLKGYNTLGGVLQIGKEWNQIQCRSVNMSMEEFLFQQVENYKCEASCHSIFEEDIVCVEDPEGRSQIEIHTRDLDYPFRYRSLVGCFIHSLQ